MTTPTYVYGLVGADVELPADLSGLGPSGRVSMVTHGGLAAIVSDVPVDRPLGTRDDLLAHEAVVDAVAERTAVLPMRFPAVVEERGVVEELLAPHQDRFLHALAGLAGRVQFTLKGRYERDIVLGELLAGDPEIRLLQQQVQGLPDEATYYDRVRLGQLVVAALEARREADTAAVVDRLAPFAVATSVGAPGEPDEIASIALLVDRDRRDAFEKAVDELGRDVQEYLRLRLLGPLAPYDFVDEG